MNLFELTLRIKGFSILEAKKQLKEIQNISEANYEGYVKEMRQGIVSYHLQENPFYRSFSQISCFSSWNEIPVMKKKDLQIPLANRLSNGYTTSNCYVNKTSGSSGHPFIFAKDKYAHALTWAEILDRYQWYGLNFSKSLEARFYGIPLDPWGYRKERFKDFLSNRYRFPIFDLSEKKMEVFLEAFRRKEFIYLNGYTSSIVLFAKYLKKKGVKLTAICPSLKFCIVTSEMLYESDKLLLETWLGVSVVNEYGASELDLIAFTNTLDQFIVNSETLYVEILNDQDEVVPNGQAGRIVITSLFNKAHPLIRYDIGDTGVLSSASTFKTPILEQLIGRTNDIARLPSGKTVPGLTFYYVTKSVIEDDGNVKEFVIEQTEINAFKILYVSERILTDNEVEHIKKALYQYLEHDLILNFERVEVLDRKNRGKLKQFISLLN